MKVGNYKTMLNEDGTPYLKRVSETNVDGRRKWSSPGDIAELIKYATGIHEAAEEYCYALYFDTKMHLVGLSEISHGTVGASLISPREVYQKALMVGASNVIVTHNHPSGDPEGSKEDYEVTRRLKEAGEIINVHFVDHIIVAREFYYSYKEMGVI